MLRPLELDVQPTFNIYIIIYLIFSSWFGMIEL